MKERVGIVTYTQIQHTTTHCMCARTHTHTHTHAHTHTHTHAHTHTRVCTRTCKHTHTYTHARMHARTHAHANTHIRTHTRAHTHTHTHTHISYSIEDNRPVQLCLSERDQDVRRLEGVHCEVAVSPGDQWDLLPAPEEYGTTVSVLRV